MVFLAFKTLLPPLGIGEKNFFVNFERYDLANGEEQCYFFVFQSNAQQAASNKFCVQAGFSHFAPEVSPGDRVRNRVFF
jgi:hypothetical protein